MLIVRLHLCQCIPLRSVTRGECDDIASEVRNLLNKTINAFAEGFSCSLSNRYPLIHLKRGNVL